MLGRTTALVGCLALTACEPAHDDTLDQRLEAGNALDTVRVALVLRVRRRGTLEGVEDGPVLSSGLELGASYDGRHYSASDYLLTVRGEPPSYTGTTVEATGRSRGAVRLILRFQDVSRDRTFAPTP